ncbi:unnamed protein product [Arabidopsis thaliana]|uniref:(thale cress) hypothetical protein n=1 Tax=Arabidopsis thaliana TaxID=3702 RepID=A0A7G2ERE8_ARATH|nr:unnamed protein product [Arabidopsis thaliana]
MGRSLSSNVDNDGPTGYMLSLRLCEASDYTFISDKQKGLVIAVHNQLPEAEHRMCARHILGNWKRDNHDIELERLFWKIARSYTKGDYADNLEALKNYSQGAYDSLLKTNPPAWYRAFFKQTYEHGIEHVEGMKLWPRLNRLPVLPPPNKLGNCGRPSNYSSFKGLMKLPL